MVQSEAQGPQEQHEQAPPGMDEGSDAPLHGPYVRLLQGPLPAGGARTTRPPLASPRRQLSARLAPGSRVSVARAAALTVPSAPRPPATTRRTYGASLTTLSAAPLRPAQCPGAPILAPRPRAAQRSTAQRPKRLAAPRRRSGPSARCRSKDSATRRVGKAAPTGEDQGAGS